MPNPIPTWQYFVGFAKETTWGTPVAATSFFLVPAAKHHPRYEDQFDQGMRGSAARDQAYYQGPGWTELDWPDMLWYPDDSVHFLMAMLGVDTLTGAAKTGTIASASAGATSLSYTVGTGGAPVNGDIFVLDTGTNVSEVVTVTGVSGTGPYTLTVAATRFAHGASAPASALFSHAITLNNTTAAPSYTGVRFTGLQATAEQVAGVYWDQVELRWQNPGKLTVAARGRGLIQGSVTKPTNTYSNAQFVIPWQAKVTIASLSDTQLVDATVTIARPVDMLFGQNGTQNASAAVQDRLAVTGKMTFLASDMAEFNYYFQNAQPSVLVQFAGGSGLLNLQMSKCAFNDPTEIDMGGKYARTMVSFNAIANATDASTGVSPLKATGVSSRSTTY